MALLQDALSVARPNLRIFTTSTKSTDMLLHIATNASHIIVQHIKRGLGFFLIGYCLISASGSAQAQQIALAIDFPTQHQQLALTDLLRHPAVRTITIPFDVTYKQTMHYRALPLRAILRDLHQVETIQFKAKDGFVATLPAQLLSGAAEPWLAIEPPNDRWPALKPGSGSDSAGPFYLVWIAPEKSAIKPEQWPYQIVAINAVLPLPQRYPQILPAASLGTDSIEYRGMQHYIQQCASCHQINHGGDASIGPDLNLPFNPTEYFQPDYLRKYIRDPASIRSWPQMRMPGFSPSVIDDAQLDELLAYLRHMRTRKIETAKMASGINTKAADLPSPSSSSPKAALPVSR